MRRILAVFAAVMLGLFASAGRASASDPGGSAEQAAANAAASAQSALALAGAPQSNPSNDNIAVRVLSPGDAGSVSQSNTVIAGSVAANGNSTSQTANQTQAGGSGTQAAGQVATNDQSAVSAADAEQLDASNENIDVRVLSPGDGGSVTQANTVIAGSLAANGNETTQSSNQTQAGGGPAMSTAPGYGHAGSRQTGGQAASNTQDATAGATASQHGAKNRNIAVRVLSPGDDGSVTQSNTVAGIAAALNGNSTTQSQGQNGVGGGTQTALQGAISSQAATSTADAHQTGASNENIGVRVLSPGDGGSVTQSNTVLAGSLAANGNHAAQTASQSQAGGYGPAQQVAGQAATNDQSAQAGSTASQEGASNTNIGVRIGSEGDDGAVSQSNTVAAIAAALNGNHTSQAASQNQVGGGAPGVQALGQLAESAQGSEAVSTGSQEDAANVNTPVWIGSDGDGGSTYQANTVLSGAIAANGNHTSQAATQSQSGPGTVVQAAGQAALNKQDALACANAMQHGAENTNAPVRLFSVGDDGSVTQQNKAAAIAAAVNGNKTAQSAGQTQVGGAGSPAVQAVGQAAGNQQAAAGAANADQRGASNTSKRLSFGREHDKQCESRKPECDRYEPCERLKRKHCPERRCLPAR